MGTFYLNRAYILPRYDNAVRTYWRAGHNASQFEVIYCLVFRRFFPGAGTQSSERFGSWKLDLSSQLFFADRVRRFSGNSYIFICCSTLSLWRLGVGIWATVKAMEMPNIIFFSRKYRLAMMFYALGSTIDLTIAVSLCYLVKKHRKSPFKRCVVSVFFWARAAEKYFRTVRLVDNLIAWTIGKWQFYNSAVSNLNIL